LKRGEYRGEKRKIEERRGEDRRGEWRGKKLEREERRQDDSRVYSPTHLALAIDLLRDCEEGSSPRCSWEHSLMLVLMRKVLWC
jgi:hypothetical protein